MALPRTLGWLRWLALAVPPLTTAIVLPRLPFAAPPPPPPPPPAEAASAARPPRPPQAILAAMRRPALDQSGETAPMSEAGESAIPQRRRPAADEAARASPSGQEIFFGPSDTGKVALTFDDGPSAELTPWVLNTLRRHGVRATFFVLGRRARVHPELLAKIQADGHEIGSHGFSHTSLRSLGPEAIVRELDDTTEAIVEATGTAPTLFRPPFGRYADSAVALVADRGMNLVLWNADGRDWDGDAEAIVQRVLDQARPGAIVLLHDRETETARALPRILEGLHRKGLAVVPVSELVGLPTPPAGSTKVPRPR